MALTLRSTYVGPSSALGSRIRVECISPNRNSFRNVVVPYAHDRSAVDAHALAVKTFLERNHVVVSAMMAFDGGLSSYLWVQPTSGELRRFD